MAQFPFSFLAEKKDAENKNDNIKPLESDECAYHL
jgi:hypothetical protein